MSHESYFLFYKRSDPTTCPVTGTAIKTIYGSTIEHFDENPESGTFTLPIRKAYTSEKCEIRTCGSERDDDYVPAYPGYLTIEELAILFPRCVRLTLSTDHRTELAELARFAELKSLYLNSKSQGNIDGIEFLGSLESLSLYIDLTKAALAQLSDLPLKDLRLRCPKIRSLAGLETINLQHLWVECPNLLTLEGLDFNNLKVILVEASEARILATAKLPDGCLIVLGESTIECTGQEWGSRMYRLIRKMFPNCEVHLDG